MKYESPITYHSKDVKVFADRQTDRPKTIFRYGDIKNSEKHD
jgi:hypothetical protein